MNEINLPAILQEVLAMSSDVLAFSEAREVSQMAVNLRTRGEVNNGD